jgi:uncharacterized protein (DUF2141 family)
VKRLAGKGFKRSALIGLSLLAAPAISQAADLLVTVKQSPRECAPLMVAVFTSPDNFMREPAYYATAETASEAKLTFANLPQGWYAVTAYCDNNGNGELDAGAFNKPIEPVGFSRNPIIRARAPKFSDAHFSIKREDVQIRLIMR